MDQHALKENCFESQSEGYDNVMEVEFESRSVNEQLARTIVSAFILPLNPTMEEISDVKTAVSEAVTNCIIHGYPGKIGKIKLACRISKDELEVEVIDHGVGIPNITVAMEPCYTSARELERSGMGFTFMCAFMDQVNVSSVVGQGTSVVMRKKIESC